MFDWVVGTIEGSGYAGIFFLMVLENIFPPIPSELIIPLVGFAAAEGDLNIVLAILAATLGAVVGAIPWYVLGRAFGLERVKKLSEKHGRLTTMSPSDVDLAQKWFDKHDGAAVFVGRLIPTVRTLISVPAGVARMKLPPFFIYTALGSAVWTTLLALLGYVLQSQYTLVEEYLNPVSNAVVIIIVGWYLYRVVTFKAVKT